jgi:hypothetical protein
VKRLAVFVEGATEQVFVEQLLLRVVGAHRVLIDSLKTTGGAITEIRAANPEAGQEFYVLLLDCGGDTQVATKILEQHESLTQKHYERIVGLRDVYPITRDDIQLLQQGLVSNIRLDLAPVQFVLATMEIEAWFLAETSHFSRVSPAITSQAVQARLGFDPDQGDVTERDRPSLDLDAVYQIGGRRYEKGRNASTPYILDYDRLYLELGERVPQLRGFLDTLDRFFSTV